MDVNAKIYHNDMTKIAFMLSFMDEGDTSSWKEQFLEKQRQLPPMTTAPGQILKEI